MRFRKLRIAWSVVCGIACVLLIVLCVRSYRWCDILAYRKGQTTVAVGTGRGIAVVHWITFQPSVTLGNKLGWDLVGGPAEEVFSSVTPLEWRVVKDPSTVFRLIISVPCWLCVTFIATIAAAPWIRQLRWRFSLRTLLIATTLFAVVLGLIVYVARK